ncbi:PadR family transcriptional regulator [Dysosmobacter sp.]|uniref:PadR family transcriptional regulator n=1 Tax=Dysosmobacter sp. TaxID=2591382 RepID=UPI002A8FFA3E|nr:PadR family transcriptional regulator [Dysosmobacter sp.]MDY3282533.1 PadR family transcriptional regulator [Dysosmobacter sp.]
MASIDLVILGMVLERPRSAYDLQKDVEYHHFSRWTRISVPSVYRKVLELKDRGYLQSSTVKGDRFADKTVYSVTEAGREYFHQEMAACAGRGAPLLLECNVMVTNLNKVGREEGLALLGTLRKRICAGAEENERWAAEFADIPLVGRTIFDQQRLVYEALVKWLDGLEAALEKEPPDGWKQPDDSV